MAAPDLPRPTPELVREKALEFDRDIATGRPARALERLFRLYPTNTDPEQVLLKVAALNALYSTQIFDLVGLARHIVEGKVDPLLAAGDPKAIDRISPAPLGRDRAPRSVLSFATKYCSFHKPEAYPILDSYVEQVLVEYRRRDAFATFRSEEIRDYRTFKAKLEAFTSFYGLGQCSLRDIHRFLWLTGRPTGDGGAGQA
jgi:hypothetical protein